MQFLKSHYEKVILSVVLLGLAVAAAALPLEVNRVSEFLENTRNSVTRTTPKPFKPVDLTTNITVVKRFEGPVTFNYSAPHNLFNPALWLKRRDGSIIRQDPGESGPSALVVTNIESLELKVSYEGIGGTAEKPQYLFVVINETNRTVRQTQLASPDLKNALFELLKVEGDPKSPSSFVLKLKDEKQPITVTKDKAYRRVIGYSADLKYPPDNNKIFARRRKDQSLSLKDDSETYKIVAIDSNQVVLSADSTKKRTFLKWNPSP